MGKRKRKADLNKTPPPPDLMPPPLGMDSITKQKLSHQSEGSEIKPPFMSIIDTTDNSVKVTKGHQLSADHHHHRNISRAISLRHHRQFYGRHYSRRNSTNNAAAASTSHDKLSPSYVDKTSFKLASKYRPDSGSGDHSDAGKLICSLCQKFMRKKPCILETVVHSSDHSVAAVLSCGHVYHADCLEERTPHEDRWDPPCPQCSPLLSG
ncbi:PREDICTED: uncharacterized protein LOC109147306 [Ipomoea nil]|uniref:uncharacterized protein LOC109147306 n=1 Tax=Ipomoea nil TaxID=35883 RepID=UPI000901858D|nr:PREDICTED: uncharacterized protein LOC109147306 [Ipomoea nil]